MIREAKPLTELNLGEMIKSLRIDRGLTATELARLCKCNQSTISKYESGRRTPTMRALTSLLEALDAELLFVRR